MKNIGGGSNGVETHSWKFQAGPVRNRKERDKNKKITGPVFRKPSRTPASKRTKSNAKEKERFGLGV